MFPVHTSHYNCSCSYYIIIIIVLLIINHILWQCTHKKVKGVPSLSKCVQCFKHCTDTEQQVVHVLKTMQFK